MAPYFRVHKKGGWGALFSLCMKRRWTQKRPPAGPFSWGARSAQGNPTEKKLGERIPSDVLTVLPADEIQKEPRWQRSPQMQPMPVSLLGHRAEWRREGRECFRRSKWKIPSTDSKAFSTIHCLPVKGRLKPKPKHTHYWSDILVKTGDCSPCKYQITFLMWPLARMSSRARLSDIMYMFNSFTNNGKIVFSSLPKSGFQISEFLQSKP